MPESAGKRCLVALDMPSGPALYWVQLPADATVAVALVQARDLAGSGPAAAAIDWDGAATGVWGVRCERSAVLRDGDRIELYRPLTTDPRQRRRQRAVKARRGAKGPAR